MHSSGEFDDWGEIWSDGESSDPYASYEPPVEDDEESALGACPFCNSDDVMLLSAAHELYECRRCGEPFDELDGFEAFDPSARHRDRLRREDQ